MLKKLFTSLLFASIVLLISCSDDNDPGFSGYFTIDGTKYFMNVAGIHLTYYPQINYNEQSIFVNSVVFHGKEETQRIEIKFISDTHLLKNETFTASGKLVDPYFRDPLDIHTCLVVTDDILLNSMTDAEGTFTITAKEGYYTFDLDMVIEGHVVKAHYKGQSQLTVHV